MSTTETKRPHAQALADAQAFRELFPARCYDSWTFAGSIRRNLRAVADVEHVVIPAFGEVEVTTGLFPTRERVNLLWHRLDELLAAGHVTKHEYGETATNRWGEKYRGVDFRGFNHELFCADADNFGAILTIRTGPADYSQRLVTKLKDGGMYRQVDGYVIHVASGDRVSVPDEAAYLKLCGATLVGPAFRS